MAGFQAADATKNRARGSMTTVAPIGNRRYSRLGNLRYDFGCGSGVALLVLPIFARSRVGDPNPAEGVRGAFPTSTHFFALQGIPARLALGLTPLIEGY